MMRLSFTFKTEKFSGLGTIEESLYVQNNIDILKV